MIIKRGKHSSFNIGLTFKSKVKKEVTLIGDFSYKTDDPKNQKDTNKIFGLSDNWHHHKDSIRIGFRYVNNEIELMSYIYVKGQHISNKIGIVKTDEPFIVSIDIQSKKYVIEYDNQTFEFERKSNWKFIRYKLFPYFGGQEKAKNDLTFILKDI